MNVTFFHGVQEMVEMLRCFGVVLLNLHAVTGPEELRVLTVPHVVLVVELQVPQDQPVFLRFHIL